VYTSFAFIISLIREVIKDMEDMDGDRKYGCRTMPIVWGLKCKQGICGGLDHCAGSRFMDGAVLCVGF
jgi:4-hydroxybenzoate polyprenyltransferase